MMLNHSAGKLQPSDPLPLDSVDTGMDVEADDDDDAGDAAAADDDVCWV